eukprot:gene41674-4237_t
MPNPMQLPASDDLKTKAKRALKSIVQKCYVCAEAQTRSGGA